MAKPRKDQEMDETLRIMERLVNSPHKPHKESKLGKREGTGKARAGASADKEAAPVERGHAGAAGAKSLRETRDSAP
jgi:hypothetical protein